MFPTQPPYVVFAGGGTLGHLFPGLAVAEQLAHDSPGLRMAVVGTGRPLEMHLAHGMGLEYWPVPCRPFPRSWRQTLGFVTGNWAGFRAARRVLDAHRVSCVVGLGGYASVPMARAALARGVPLVLLEQNLVPGRATRWLARRAAVVCTSFAESRPHFRPDCALRLTGNPVRPEFFRQAARRRWTEPNVRPHFAESLMGRPREYPPKTRRLLVLGGTAGAASLNRSVPAALHQARAALRGWAVVHQSGPVGFEATQSLYRTAGIQATVVRSIANMPAMLASSDLVLSRAGGTTLAELAVVGVPAILVPYPHAADDHQRRNAEPFVAAGAAVLLDERDAGGQFDQLLACALAELAQGNARRVVMAGSMRGLGLPDAAWDIATMVRGLIRLPAVSNLPVLPHSVDARPTPRVLSHL